MASIGDEDAPSNVVPSDDPSARQITAFIGSLIGSLEPLAKQQTQVQLRQIEASEEQDKRRFQFARTQLFTGAAILLVIISLLALAAAFLFVKNREEDALRVILFGMGALSGYGFGRVGRPRQ